MDTHEGLDPADAGRVVDTDAGTVLRFERGLAHSPAEVWAVLTEPGFTAKWAFRSTYEPRAGGSVMFDFGEAGSVTGDVLAWDEPRLLEYAYDGMGSRWHLRYSIRDTDDGCLLTLDHVTPDPHNPDYAAGWHWYLDRLTLVLGGGVPAPVPSDAHFEELQRFYAHAEG